jgi:hypothetical protein
MAVDVEVRDTVEVAYELKALEKRRLTNWSQSFRLRHAYGFSKEVSKNLVWFKWLVTTGRVAAPNRVELGDLVDLDFADRIREVA